MKSEIKSLYIHVPFCKHLCNYCDFYKNIKNEDDNKQFDDYFDYLESSLNIHNALNKKMSLNFGKLDTLYFGGGTPSLLKPLGIERLFILLNKFNISFDNKTEVTLEVNPGTTSLNDLQLFKNLGVNRISTGVQSLNNSYLKKLDRLHDSSKALEIINDISSVFANFSVDFMLGLPIIKNEKRDIKNELDQILKINPKHISLYILTVKNDYVHKKVLPDDKYLEEEYLFVSNYLIKKGFKHYEVSNFSKPGYESQHNLNYWKSKSVAALGPSATGYFYSQKLRYVWNKKLPKLSEENLNNSEQKLESFYMRIRSSLGIKYDNYFTGEDKLKFINLVKNWEQRGLAKYNNEAMRLNSNGYLVIDSLMDEVFNHTNSI